MSKDYYKILGVTKNSTAEEIKKAYYKLAHQHHPNKGGDEAKMKEVNEAYSVLGNAEKRSQYDQYGQTFDQARSQGGGAGFGGFGDFSDFANAFGGQQGGAQFNFDMGDIFGDLFGGGRASKKSNTRNQGEDIRVDLGISFREAVFGAEKTFNLPRQESCETCNGNGAQKGSDIVTCKTCNGTGQVIRNVGFGIGFPSVCQKCDGAGKIPEKLCGACNGSGHVRSKQNISVKIPAGIDHGQMIRITGKGNAGYRGGPAGDLYVRVIVEKDSRFVRDGYDIITKKEITFSQAALGAEIEIETLDGPTKLKIPEGTQTGKVFQIKDKGVPHLHSRNRGDQLVEVTIKTPTKLSRKQKELLRELDA